MLVEDASAELQYSVNTLARALPTGRTGMVGSILEDVRDPNSFCIIGGAQAEAATRGLTLVIAHSNGPGSTGALIAMRMQSSTDGIVLASPGMTDTEIRTLNEKSP